MAKVKVEWTIEVTETYSTTIDFEDFATLFDAGAAPTLDELKAGEFGKSDIDANGLADSEEENNRDFVSVDERYIESIEVIED